MCFLFLINYYLLYSIGSLGKYADEGDVRGVRIKNCSLTGTTNGLRIKAWPERYPGAASDVSFSDIIMKDVKNPIIIDQEYDCEPANCQKKVYFISFSLFNPAKNCTILKLSHTITLLI